jgi:hypothetical protein
MSSTDRAEGFSSMEGLAMHLSTRQWYIAFAIIALAPIGVRVLIWKSQAPAPVDPAMAAAGQVLFVHEWKPHDPLANGGDGLGPVYNANSCIACHSQGGAGGGGDLEHNVTLFAMLPTTPNGKLARALSTSTPYHQPTRKRRASWEAPLCHQDNQFRVGSCLVPKVLP